MTRWIETDSNANIDISAATVIGSYTADADRLVVPQLLIDQAAGNGDYVYYAALQVNGAGSWYVIGPKTTHAAAALETAIGAQGSPVAMRSGDILRVYVDGLAGDTVTPDTLVRFFELEPVRQAIATELTRIDAATSTRLAPTDAGRTLDILATGEASANVTIWKGATAPDAPPSKAELDAAVDTLPTAAENADAVWDELLAGHAGAGSTGAALSAAGAAGDPWSTALPGAYADGTAGDIIGSLADIDLSSITYATNVNAGHLTITAYRTFDGDVTGLTIPADWVAAIWTLKWSADQPDTAAQLQLRATNPAAGTDGLLRVNGAAPASPITAADGVLTVSQATGAINVFLTDELTALLAKGQGLDWDCKFIDDDGDSTAADGTADVVLSVTRAVA